MYILAVIHTPVFGGPHNQVLRLADPLRRRGWEMVTILPSEGSDAAARLRAAGVSVELCPLHRPRKSIDPRLNIKLLLQMAPEVRRIREIIHANKIDVVQIFGPMNMHGAFAAHLENVPLVWQLLSTFTPPLIRRALMPAVIRLADVVMTTGVQIAREHPGAIELGARLVPFYPPVNTREFLPNPAVRKAARQRLGVPEGSFLVGTVGNFNWMKGHEFLVRAAAIVGRNRSDTVFRILGSPTPSHAPYYAREVIREARQLGLLEASRLSFIEPGDRVAEMLCAFDLFVLTSRAEGVPTAILEAMSCGLPVVATDVGSIKEVVENDVTGFVIPALDPISLAHAILKLAREPDKCRAMGEAARRRAVDRYDLEICTEVHIQAFERALVHHSGLRSQSIN